MSALTQNEKQHYRRSFFQKHEEKLWAYFFIAPLVIGLFIFYIMPIIQTVYYSFTEMGLFGTPKFVGLDNFKELIKDKAVWQALLNTLKYVVITVPIGIFISILLAALLNSDIKGKSFYRTLYYLPVVTMPAAVAMVWKWMFNGSYGIINTVLGSFGIPATNWLSDPKVALFAVSVVSIWSTVGYNMIIILAGIQGISKSFYEAASVDGASKIKQFFKITLPMLTPTLFFVIITGLISAFQIFDTIYMMVPTSSLAAESTQSAMMLFYRNAFDYSRKGYASAIAMLVMLIIMVITVFQLKMQKKWVNYDE